MRLSQIKDVVYELEDENREMFDRVVLFREFEDREVLMPTMRRFCEPCGFMKGNPLIDIRSTSYDAESRLTRAFEPQRWHRQR